MDKGQSEVRIKKGTGPLGVCPYLGVQDDPATHYVWAKPGHFCYRVRPAQPIAVNHQENFCMNGRYPTCVVYPATWRGQLPPQVRDDAYLDWSTRAAVIKSTITNMAGSQVDTQPVEKSTARFGMDLSLLRDQADFTEEDEAAPAWWTTRNARIALLALLLIPIFIISAWAIISTTRASQDEPPGLAVAQSSAMTATWQAAMAAAVSAIPPTTQVAVVIPPTEAPTTTYTPTPTEIQASSTPLVTPEPSVTATPGATSTATQPAFTCNEIEAYTLEVVDGPILTPSPGAVYPSLGAVPPMRSTWVVQNNGFCNWTEILLISRTSLRTLVPFLRVNGQLVTPGTTQGGYTIAPGQQVEILLGFTQTSASSIRSDWDLIINGHRLTNQPPLSIDVYNWVLVQNSSSSPTTGRSSGSSSNSSQRPTSPPPSTRP